MKNSNINIFITMIFLANIFFPQNIQSRNPFIFKEQENSIKNSPKITQTPVEKKNNFELVGLSYSNGDKLALISINNEIICIGQEEIIPNTSWQIKEINKNNAILEDKSMKKQITLYIE